jgi:ATP-dependent Clp protease ATP-binding subunit ClpA
MPKVNVYLPDELALSVRDAKIPISAVCQQALTDAVRAVSRARRAVRALRDPDVDHATLQQVTTGISRRATPRLASALEHSRAEREGNEPIGTADLLIGILDEGHNLAVSLLQSLDVDLEELRRAACAVALGTEASAASPAPADPALSAFAEQPLTLPARFAIAAMLEAAIELGHNYLGCEHLLLALLATADGSAARILASVGVEEEPMRKAVAGALAGFAHARAASSAAPIAIEEIVRRLDAIERRIGPLE